MLSFYVSFFRCVLGTAAVAVAAGGGGRLCLVHVAQQRIS